MIEKNIMKFIIRGSVISMALISCGCSTQYLSQYREEVYFIDYQPYANQGFIISPISSGFIYQSIGEITMIFTPGILDSSNQDALSIVKDNIHQEINQSDNKLRAEWQIKAATFRRHEQEISLIQEQELERRKFTYTPAIYEMTDKIVEKAREFGANALLNFKIEIRTTYLPARVGGIKTTIPKGEYVLSGFAVKLND